MTDRHAGYVVVLADDVREDDAEQGVLNAIRQLRGVVDVQPITGSSDHNIGRMRANTAWQDALLDLVRNGPGGGDNA